MFYTSWRICQKLRTKRTSTSRSSSKQEEVPYDVTASNISQETRHNKKNKQHKTRQKQKSVLSPDRAAEQRKRSPDAGFPRHGGGQQGRGDRQLSPAMIVELRTPPRSARRRKSNNKKRKRKRIEDEKKAGRKIGRTRKQKNEKENKSENDRENQKSKRSWTRKKTRERKRTRKQNKNKNGK